MAQMPAGTVAKPVNNNRCIFAHHSRAARHARSLPGGHSARHVAVARRTFRMACCGCSVNIPRVPGTLQPPNGHSARHVVVARRIPRAACHSHPANIPRGASRRRPANIPHGMLPPPGEHPARRFPAPPNEHSARHVACLQSPRGARVTLARDHHPLPWTSHQSRLRCSTFDIDVSF